MGGWPVGERSEVVVDPHRPTFREWGGHLHRIAGRRLVLTEWYPAIGVPPDGHDYEGALPAAGPFPVIAFAHGYAASPATYERTLRAWAAAGYVVVAPEFPGSGADGPGEATEADLTEQPKDLSEAIDVVTREAQPGSVFAGVADLAHVGVAGHSDGGSTVVRMVLSTAYRDPRISAAVVLAGSRLGGNYTRRPTVPTLLVTGDHDEFNSRLVFSHVFSAIHGPRAWVDVVHGRHLPPFVAAGGQPQTLRNLEIAWFDRRLKGLDTSNSFRSLASQPNVTRLVAGGP